jgi:hypothetical protein
MLGTHDRQRIVERVRTTQLEGGQCGLHFCCAD